LSAFIKAEQERWRCAKCGGVICVHRGCLRCGPVFKQA
jgi:ribosomal protein L32